MDYQNSKQMAILNSIDRENAVKELNHLKEFLEMANYRGIIYGDIYNNLLKYEEMLYNLILQFDTKLLKSTQKQLKNS